MAKFSNISRRTVAVFGFIFALGNAVPEEGGFQIVGLALAALWFVGALFTWKNKVWAAILLAVLAVYDLLRNLPDFINLRTFSRDFSAEINLGESTIFIISLIWYSILTAMCLCMLFYGIHTLITKLNKPNPT